MAKLVTVEQMRALEQAAVQAGVSEREMMASAGLAVSQEAWIASGMDQDSACLILCGPGKNGGDGLSAAVQLLEWEIEVSVYLTRPRPDDDPEWAAVRAAGITTMVADDDPGFAILAEWLRSASVIVDAVLGIGTRPAERPVEGTEREVLRQLGAARGVPGAPGTPQLVAVDVPSGVDADTGFADPVAVKADLTVTFQCSKVGLFVGAGAALAGRVEVAEIGVPAEAVEGILVEDLRVRALRGVAPKRSDYGNKGTFGQAVIAAGSRRYPGAARLAAEAAARSGCGLVTLAAPEAIQPLLVGLPDPTHEPLPSSEGQLSAESARALLRALQGSKAHALLAGPGMGLSDETRGFVQHLIAGLDGVGDLEAVVLDADALNVLAEEAEWWTRTSMPRVLTPHPGEMARLLGTNVEGVQARRPTVALEYAARTGSVVVLKGAGTVIAAPDGRARISDVATSALAHAGTGDVLAGLIVGLLAQGMTPFDAASAAVWVHAEAARQVAEEFGAASTLASDVVKALPEARQQLDGPVRDRSLDQFMSRFEQPASSDPSGGFR